MFHLFQSTVEMRLSLWQKKGLQANKSWESEAVWLAVVLRLFIAL